MESINLLNKIKLVTEGQGKIGNWFQNYYRDAHVDDERADIEVRIHEGLPNTTYEIRRGGPEIYYAKSTQGFHIVNNRAGAHIILRDDWREITISQSTSPFLLVDLVEFHLRREMVKDGFGLLHASGAVVGNTGYVFPAWRHTGKTNTVLTLLKHCPDSKFLSDDRLWINQDGIVQAYHLPINMYPYNYNVFPELNPYDTYTKARSKLYDSLNQYGDRNKSILHKALLFINNYYIKPDLGQLVHMPELLDNTEQIDRQKIDELVLLETRSTSQLDNQNIVDRQSTSSEQFLSAIKAISNHEWNSNLLEYGLIQDSLFGTGKAAEIEELIKKENDIFKKLVTVVPTSQQYLPQQSKWESNEIRSELARIYS